MKNLPLIGLTCLGTACGVALPFSAIAANLTDNDTCLDNNSCTSVFTELAIILDGSDSVTSQEFGQLLDIYQSVFGSSTFYEQILEPLPTQKIAVSVFQFGYKDSQRVEQNIGWTLLESQEDAESFADLFSLDNIPQIPKMGGSKSPIGNSIDAAHTGIDQQHPGLRNNTFAGEYLIIDIGSDGYDWSPSISWHTATRDAYNDNINAINGISIDPTDRPAFVPSTFFPILDNIVSLTHPNGDPLIPNDPNARWSNPSGTVGFLQDAEGNLDNYRQLLANKIAQEILPDFDPDQDYLPPNDTDPTETVPEPSLLWGLFSLSVWGVVRKLIRRR